MTMKISETAKKLNPKSRIYFQNYFSNPSFITSSKTLFLGNHRPPEVPSDNGSVVNAVILLLSKI